MNGLRRYGLYVVCTALTVFLVSCATGGAPAVKRSAELRNLGITTKGEQAKVEVVDIIQPGDPSSWVEDARWTEVVVRISNTSKVYLVGREAQLVDASGAVIPVAEHPMMLADIQEQVSKSMVEAQARSAVASSAAYTATSLMNQGLYSLGPSAWGAVPYLGVVFSAAGALAAQHQASEMASATKGPQEIVAELQRRSFRAGSGVAPGGRIQGSFFFPYTRDPHKLLLTQEAEGKLKTMEVSLARAVSDLNVRVESALLKTDQGELPLGRATDPIALGSATNLNSVGLSFSRPLSPLELQNLRIGFTEDFPCTKPAGVDVTPDQKSVLLSGYPAGCLKGAKGFYDLAVAGLNIDASAFPVQKGFPPGTKRPTVATASTRPAPAARSANPFVEVTANEAVIREAPKTGKIIRTVSKGTKLERLEERDNWTKVVTEKDEVGWISSGAVK